MTTEILTGFVAVCPRCDWVGPSRSDSLEAVRDFDGHVCPIAPEPVYRVTAYASWELKDAGIKAHDETYPTAGEAEAVREDLPYPIVDVIREDAGQLALGL